MGVVESFSCFSWVRKFNTNLELSTHRYDFKNGYLEAKQVVTECFIFQISVCINRVTERNVFDISDEMVFWQDSGLKCGLWVYNAVFDVLKIIYFALKSVNHTEGVF